MDNRKSITYLLAVIAVLVIGLAASIGYIIGNSSSSNAIQNPTSGINNDKVLKEVEELKSMYDSKIQEKTITYNDLQSEKEKVQSLLSELEKTKGDANSLLKYKTQYQNLESKMRLLVEEIVVLKNKKINAVATKVKASKNTIETSKKPEITTVNTPIKEIKKEVVPVKQEVVIAKQEVPEKKDVIISKPEIIEKKPEKTYSDLNVSNLKSGGFISKSATKLEETTSANKADLIKITFTVEQNSNAKAEEKKYYIQIINSKNNVLGQKITEFFDDKSLTYSFSKAIDYQNQAVQVTQELRASDFEKGTYFVNIFDRSKLVAKTSFILK